MMVACRQKKKIDQAIQGRCYATTSRIKLAIAGAIALSMFSQAVHAVPIQWAIADGGNGHWYEFIHREGINWFAANVAATSSTHLGVTGHLATITSDEENAFVFSTVDVSGSVLLGGFQAGGPEPDGGWAWVTGETWAYTNWAGGEPNDFGLAEAFLAFDDFSDRGDTWNDVAGFFGASGYVIEYPVPVPEPPVLTLLGAALLGFGLRRTFTSHRL